MHSQECPCILNIGVQKSYMHTPKHTHKHANKCAKLLYKVYGRRGELSVLICHLIIHLEKGAVKVMNSAYLIWCDNDTK